MKMFLSLGPTPLANSFLKSPDEFDCEKSYPLDVYFCGECYLVQLLHVVDPAVLFTHYVYLTGTATSIVLHNQLYAKTVVELLGLQQGDLVIEVASNNGSLLNCFKDHGVEVLGIEPAENIAEIANMAGIETINGFFDSRAAYDIRTSYGQARAVVANNVLAHVDDTQDFLDGCAELLADDGLVMIEVPYLKEFVDRIEFDTVYHEHLCYFSVSSLIRLCEASGLSIVRVDPVPVHGGSLRIYAGKNDKHQRHSKDVLALADSERDDGLTSFETFTRFAAKVEETRDRLRTMLSSLRDEGRTLAAYGAPAKGNTLLNYCGIGKDELDFIVDKNPLKCGLYSPGAHLPVLPVSIVLEKQPDYLLILAWNFAEEIMEQQSEYRARGGRFIIPIPEPRII